MSFNQLSDSLLLTILGKVALSKRLQLRLPRWLGLIEKACLEQTSLKLFGLIDDVEDYCEELNRVHHDDLDYWTLKHAGKDDDLVVSEHFGEEKCDLLARLFVNVKHLIVYFRHQIYIFWPHVPYLLKKFNELNSLSLCGSFVEEDDSDDDSKDGEYCTDSDDHVCHITFEYKQKWSSKILSKINSMTSLTRLDLLVDNFFSFTDSFRPSSIYSDKEYRKVIPMKKVLAKLERFSLNGGFYPSDDRWESDNCGRPTELPWNCSSREVFGPKCTHLRLENIPFGTWNDYVYDSVVCFDHVKNLQCLQMKGIERNDVRPYEGPLLYEVSKVKSLQCLWLHFLNTVSVGDDTMLYDLTKLENLTELRFESNDSVMYDPDNLSMPDAKESIGSPLESVKHISWFSFEFFSCDAQFDGKLFYKQMSAWFPNLEELCIYFDTINHKIATIVDQLEANVDMLPHLSKHRFEKSTQDIVNTEFTGRFEDFGLTELFLSSINSHFD